MGTILSFAHTKGGVGKSTLACQIAVLAERRGLEVLLVDADAQRTATLFAAARKEAGKMGRLTAVEVRGKTAHQDLARLAEKYELVVVDAGGKDSMTLRSVLVASGTVVMPVAPRGPELWATDDVMAVIGEVRAVNEKLRAVCLVNRADAGKGKTQATRVSEARSYLAATEGLELLPVAVGNRIAFADAITAGLSVCELRPQDGRANEELRRLYDSIIGVSCGGYHAGKILSPRR